MENTPTIIIDNQNEFIKRINNYQPNSLTTSKQLFTLQEKKILSLVINQFNHTATYLPNTNVGFKIPLTELAEHMNYTEAKTAAKNLLDKKTGFENNKTKEFEYRNLFVSTRYNKNKSGYLELVISSECISEFIDLGRLYTRYNLEMFLSFTSKYTQRIYEIVMLHVGRNQFEFTVELAKFKEIINAEKYVVFSDFRRKVLEVAQKEFAEKTDIILEYSTNGKLRNISHLTFNIVSWKKDAKSEVQVDLQNFLNAPEKNQYNGIRAILEKSYQFRKDQIEKILCSQTLREKFVEIDAKINVGLIDIKTSKTRYMAVCLGIEER
jgi:plasmid replication initiation protein